MTFTAPEAARARLQRSDFREYLLGAGVGFTRQRYVREVPLADQHAVRTSDRPAPVAAHFTFQPTEVKAGGA